MQIVPLVVKGAATLQNGSLAPSNSKGIKYHTNLVAHQSCFKRVLSESATFFIHVYQNPENKVLGEGNPQRRNGHTITLLVRSCSYGARSE